MNGRERQTTEPANNKCTGTSPTTTKMILAAVTCLLVIITLCVLVVSGAPSLHTRTEVKIDAHTQQGRETHTQEGTMHPQEGATHTQEGATYTQEGATHTQEGTMHPQEGATHTGGSNTHTGDSDTHNETQTEEENDTHNETQTEEENNTHNERQTKQEIDTHNETYTKKENDTHNETQTEEENDTHNETHTKEESDTQNETQTEEEKRKDLLETQKKALKDLGCRPVTIRVEVERLTKKISELRDKNLYPKVIAVDRCQGNNNYGESGSGSMTNNSKYYMPHVSSKETREVAVYFITKGIKQYKLLTVEEHTSCSCDG